MSTTNRQHAQPITAPRPPPFRRYELAIPTGFAEFSDAQVRAGIADAWTQYLDGLAVPTSTPPIRAQHVRELVLLCAELLHRADAEDRRYGCI